MHVLTQILGQSAGPCRVFEVIHSSAAYGDGILCQTSSGSPLVEDVMAAIKIAYRKFVSAPGAKR